jgi:hypothetical protein
LGNPREAQASTTMVDATLNPNSRELEDGEVIGVTELTPEGLGITQDVESVMPPDHVSPSVVDDEEPPLKQVRESTPQ